MSTPTLERQRSAVGLDYFPAAALPPTVSSQTTRDQRALEERREAQVAVALGGLQRWDYVWMGLGLALAMMVSLVLGHGRIFWEDEMLGWMVVRDPSWHHMIQAWKMGADGGGFSFYVTCREWLHLFGLSEISYRMYSAVCFGLAFFVNWITARRFYGRWVVGFALFNTYFGSSPIALHLGEGRFYGLLMLAASLAVWATVKSQELVDPTLKRLYWMVFTSHALLTTSHLLGVVYSGFILLAMVVLDRLEGRWRPLLYGSAAVSWLLLIPERESILAAAQVGKPWFWTVPITLSRYMGVYCAFSGEVSVVLALLFLLVAVSLWRRRDGWVAVLRRAAEQRRQVYVIAVCAACGVCG